MTTTPQDGAVLVRAAEAELLDNDPTGSILLLADSDVADGRLTCHRSTFLEGSGGAPPHLHKRSAELFFVLSGALDVLLGEEIVTLDEGDFLLVPPDTPHAFAPPVGKQAEVLFAFVPGVPRDDYYRLLDRVYAGEADATEIAATQERFDNYYVESPTWQAR